MNTLKKIILYALLVSLVAIPLVASQQEEDFPFEQLDEEEDVDSLTEVAVSSNDDSDWTPLRGIGRLLAQKKTTSRVPALATCDKYPKICRQKGSPGRACCKKKCVNTRTDRLNCGKCGHRCKYSEICCKGKCVNPMRDRKHCGGCNNECKHKKGKCVYGMCSYA